MWAHTSICPFAHLSIHPSVLVQHLPDSDGACVLSLVMQASVFHWYGSARMALWHDQSWWHLCNISIAFLNKIGSLSESQLSQEWKKWPTESWNSKYLNLKFFSKRNSVWLKMRVYQIQYLICIPYIYIQYICRFELWIILPDISLRKTNLQAHLCIWKHTVSLL